MKYAKIGDRMKKLWSAEVKNFILGKLLFMGIWEIRVSIFGNPSLSPPPHSLSSLPCVPFLLGLPVFFRPISRPSNHLWPPNRSQNLPCFLLFNLYPLLVTKQPVEREIKREKLGFFTENPHRRRRNFRLIRRSPPTGL